MDISKPKKIKHSQKILSFIRNEHEKGKEWYIVHRSMAGVREVSEAGTPYKQRVPKKIIKESGMMDQEEIEDIPKIYDQVKTFIKQKHGTTFKPQLEEVKKYMDAYLSDKGLRVVKQNYFNSKKMREEMMKNYLQTRKRNSETQSGLTETKPEVILEERDQKLLEHLEKPYRVRPETVSVGQRLSQYNKNKHILMQNTQHLHRECKDMIRNQLASANQFVASHNHAPFQSSNFFESTNPSIKSTTIEFQINKRKFEEQMLNQSPKKLSAIDRSLDLKRYQITEKFQLDLREQFSNSFTHGQQQQQAHTDRNHYYEMHSPELSDHRQMSNRNPRIGFTSLQGSPRRQELQQSQQQHPYQRRNMISMITGKPVKPYLQLQSLAERIESRGKDTNSRGRARQFDENKLKSMEEFKNFAFSMEIKQVPVSHSNYNSHHAGPSNRHASVGIFASTAINGGQELSEKDQSDSRMAYSSDNNNNNNNIPDQGFPIKKAAKNLQISRMLSFAGNRESKGGTTDELKSSQLLQDNSTKAADKSQKNIYSISGFVPQEESIGDSTNLEKLKSLISKELSQNENTPRFSQPGTMRQSDSAGRNPSLFSRQHSEKIDHAQGNLSKEQSNEQRNLTPNSEISSQLLEEGKSSSQQQQRRRNQDSSQQNQRSGSQAQSKRQSEAKAFQEFQNETKKVDSEGSVQFDEVQQSQLNQKLSLRNKSRQSNNRPQVRSALHSSRVTNDDLKKAKKQEDIVTRAQKDERKLIDKFEAIKKLKEKKNEEFRGLIETLNRDRNMTREIRMNNYYTRPFSTSEVRESPQVSHRDSMSKVEDQEEQSQSKEASRQQQDPNQIKPTRVTLQQMRVNSEKQRRELVGQNHGQVEWYRATINKLASLSSNDENMDICLLLMDAIKQILEDGLEFTQQDVSKVLGFIEESEEFVYNSNSIFCLNQINSQLDNSLFGFQFYPKLQEAKSKSVARHRN